MKNATPSEKNKLLILGQITSSDADKIAIRYRKIADIKNHDFDFLIDVDFDEDWTPLAQRKDFFDFLLKQDKKVLKAFDGFTKSLSRKFPEYKYLFTINEWRYLLIEFFFIGEVQPDTEKSIPKENIFWDKNDDGILLLKIYPGTDKKDVQAFLNREENDISKKFLQIGVKLTKPEKEKRATNGARDKFEFSVRCFDTLKTEEIRNVFSLRYPTEYKRHFMNEAGGNRKNIYRVRYELIARYLFHRFGFKSPKGGPYKADYVRSIVEKASKDNAKIKPGLFKSIP